MAAQTLRRKNRVHALLIVDCRRRRRLRGGPHRTGPQTHRRRKNPGGSHEPSGAWFRSRARVKPVVFFALVRMACAAARDHVLFLPTEAVMPDETIRRR